MDFCFPEIVPWLSHWTWHHLWRRPHLASFTETAAMPSNAAGLSQLIKTCRWFKRGAVWITWTISASVNRYSPAPPTLPNLAASASWYVCHTNLHYSLFSHGSEAQKSCTHVPCASHLCSETMCITFVQWKHHLVWLPVLCWKWMGFGLCGSASWSLWWMQTSVPWCCVEWYRPCIIQHHWSCLCKFCIFRLLDLPGYWHWHSLKLFQVNILAFIYNLQFHLDQVLFYSFSCKIECSWKWGTNSRLELSLLKAGVMQFVTAWLC